MSEHVASVIGAYVRSGDRLTCALSGGVDSAVLLHLLQSLRAPLGLAIDALHVDHGLSRNASAWAEACAGLCGRLGVRLRVERVSAAPGPGQSREEAAREARYAVFATLPSRFVLLAHHRDDQAETVLLRLLRGAGPAGLAGMAPLRRQVGAAAPSILRPLLDVGRSEIVSCARGLGLHWVEDESNLDTGLDRNFLRHEVLPRLAQRFPGSAAALARSGHLAGEAGLLLEDLARLDAGGPLESCEIELGRLAGLPRARQANLLRHALAAQGVLPPGGRHLDELLRQLLEARRDAVIDLDGGGARVRRYRGRVRIEAREARPAGFPVAWQGEGCLRLPGGAGQLVFRPAAGGISRRALDRGPVSVRLRRGGERIRPDARRPRRKLKSLLQESGIPPWRREAIPLLFCGDDLVWAPGIGIDSRFQAGDADPAIDVRWER